MAELANLSLDDSVPAARTFEVKMKNGLLAGWQNSDPATVNLYPQLTIGMRSPKPGTNRKTTIKIVVPYEVVIDGVTFTKATTAVLDLIAPLDAPELAILDGKAYMIECLGQAQLTDVLREGLFPY